jgi:uncharacterized protein YjlB
MDKVYVVVYRSPDIKSRFVEIKGIFTSKDEANRWRESIFEAERKETTIETFLVMDSGKGKA